MSNTAAQPALSRAQRFRSGNAAHPASEPTGLSRVLRPTAPQVAPLEEVVGMLERVTKVSEDWSVGSMYSDERKEVKVIGAGLRDLVEGNEYTFKGRFVTHPKYGEQLDVVIALPYVRPDRNSIVRYISKNYKGVGPTTAEKYINTRLATAADQGVELEEIRQQLINAPWTLDFSSITKRASFKGDEENSPVLNFVHRDLATRLGAHGVKDRVLHLLAQYLLKLNSPEEAAKSKANLDPQIVQKCWASLVKDPYEPTRVVPGYSFATADMIGASVNIPRDAPVRLKALVAHALELGCQRGGHVFLGAEQLKGALAAVDSRVPADQAIKFGLEANMIILDESFGSTRYYTPRLHDAEVKLSEGLAKLCSPAAPLSKLSEEALAEKIQETAKRLSPALKDGLDQSQVDALVGILTSPTRLHTLTAGPGCGKTQLMEVLSEVLKHKDFVFCGPTGKSAKVLSNRLSKHGRDASTIHSTLLGSGRGSFKFNADNPLDGDVLVSDESSMNDVELGESIVAAANGQMHVILLGDDQQLPSIGAGSFLKDVLSIEAADHHRLTKTHRNSGGILEVIQQISNGQIDCVDRPGLRFSHGLGEAATEFSGVARKYIDAVGKHGFENVVLLMSMRAGEPNVPGWNTTYANAVLRDLCNAHAEKIPGTRLHVGDRILIKDNMNVPLAGSGAAQRARSADEDDDSPAEGETRVVNGDTGSILSFTRDPSKPNSLVPLHVTMHLDDGRRVDFPGNACDLLQHSYALTVHSAQGSEYKKVIAVATPGHSSFINRAMLFTGLSRAREALEVYAEDHVLRKIAATPLPTRNSALVRRVRSELAKVMAEKPKATRSCDVEPANRMEPPKMTRAPEELRAASSQRAPRMDLRAEAMSRAQRFSAFRRPGATAAPSADEGDSGRGRREERQRG